MAAPSIRGSTAPVSGLSGTSPSSTAVDDLVIVLTWERAGAGSPTHTLQGGFSEIRTHDHQDGSTDGRLSVAYKVATSAGANAYQAYTTSGSGTTRTGILVLTAGTYTTSGVVSNSDSGTNNAAPNPPSVTGLTGDFLILAIAGWYLGSAATVAAGPPTNYTEEWECAGSQDVEFALATRALTGLSSATEDPGAFTDDVAPNGTARMTIAIPAPSGQSNTPEAAILTAVAAAPTVAFGAITRTPTTGIGTTAASSPQVTFGAISRTPAAAVLTTIASDPTIQSGMSRTLVTGVGTALAASPLVSLGPVSRIPVAAVLSAVASSPTVLNSFSFAPAVLTCWAAPFDYEGGAQHNIETTAPLVGCHCGTVVGSIQR